MPRIMASRNCARRLVWWPPSMGHAGNRPTIPSPAPAVRAAASSRRSATRWPSDSRFPSAWSPAASERPACANGCRGGRRFPNPPTLVGRVRQLPDGAWESKGEAFATFTARLKPLGPRGFRAVLWHQGESDANQPDPARTLPGTLYRQYLEQLIRDSRREVGWAAPWFVAQVSYHVPGEEASPEIRAAQKSLWGTGLALEGPDTDALKGALREGNGQGVHFSGQGLREHARRWVGKACALAGAAGLFAPEASSSPISRRHPFRIRSAPTDTVTRIRSFRRRCITPTVAWRCLSRADSEPESR